MGDYVISVDLQKHINAIKLADGRAKKAVFEIAWRLAEIADEQSGLLDGTGYANIVELASDQFGYARSTTLNYVKIANRYLTGNTKEIRTICAELDDGGKATADYKVGQLNALPGNVDRDEFRRLDAAGIINKDMSADKIKQTLKEFYNPPTDPEPEPEPDPEQEQETEPEEQEETYKHTLRELFVACVSEIVLFDEPEAEEFENRNVCGYTVGEYVNDIFRDLSGLKGVQIVFMSDELDEITSAQLIDTDTGNVLLQYPDDAEVI